MARINRWVAGFSFVALVACAGVRYDRRDAIEAQRGTIDRLRRDCSTSGRDVLAKYLYQLVADAWAPLPAGMSRDALHAEGMAAAVAAAKAGADQGWVGVAYWLQLPGPFDAAAAAAATCSASEARPGLELLAEACGDVQERKGDESAAVAAWQRAIKTASNHAELLRLVGKVLKISMDPERDLRGVSPQLIVQARIFQEQRRRYEVCLANCGTTEVLASRGFGYHASSAPYAGSCAASCSAYLD